jgi:hypothetical protein
VEEVRRNKLFTNSGKVDIIGPGRCPSLYRLRYRGPSSLLFDGRLRFFP